MFLNFMIEFKVIFKNLNNTYLLCYLDIKVIKVILGKKKDLNM